MSSYRILILNQDWFAEEYRALGHEVVTCGIRNHLDIQLLPFTHIHKVFEQCPWDGEPDLILIHDESSPWYVVGLEAVDMPIFFYSVDTHHHSESHVCMGGSCHKMFLAQKDYMSRFTDIGLQVEWLPLWASRYVEASEEKKHGAVFVGNMNPKLNKERVLFFTEIQELTEVFITQGKYWEIFPFSDIVINQTVKGDLNFRVFEAMMCGSLLLTEYSENGLLELFEDGKHLITYEKNNKQDAAEKIQYYLDNPNKAREIAKAGRDEILKNHTAMTRAESVLAYLKDPTLKRPFPCIGQVASMNWAARGLLKNQSTYGLAALQHSLRLINQALEGGEAIHEEFVWHIVYACIEHDRLFSKKLGEHLLIETSTRYPELQLLNIAKIWIELNRGDMQSVKNSLAAISLEANASSFKMIDNVIREIVYPDCDEELQF